MSSAIRRALLLLLGLLFVAGAMAGPATAHEKKKHQQQQQAEQLRRAQQPTEVGQAPITPQGEAAADHMANMMDDMGMEMDRSKMSFFERLYSWLGRLHPAIVHFPIAFFPAAWFTAIVGRRRRAFAAPVQFLVVAGGIFAPLAAVAGWLTAIDADPSNILTWHRWLGTAVGVAGALLAIWAWRRPWEDRGAGMIVALTIMTIVVVVQGFLGAAITHGMEHLMF